MQTPPSKLPAVGTTIFSVMSALAAEHEAINLSQGFPDFDCDPHLFELVHAAMRAGHNQYAPMPGVPLLRERIAEKTAALYGAEYDPGEEITVTAGATAALFAAISAVVHPGDEVIVLEPAYDSYAPVITLHGGIPVFVRLTWPEYGIDWPALRQAVSPRTRLIIINSPHNPTAATLSDADLHGLAELTRDSEIFILSDEVYEHIIFDGRQHAGVAGNEELRERAFVVSSFGKTFHTTGWKIGYCLAPSGLMREFRKVHQFLTFSVATPLQYAFAEYLRDDSRYLELGNFYQTKRDLFLRMMRGSRFRPLACHGTYFQSFEYSAVSDEDDLSMAQRLTREAGVAAIPVSAFYHDGTDNRVLRFCFAKTDETLERAAERLCRI